jgi:hypothetical protein
MGIVDQVSPMHLKAWKDLWKLFKHVLSPIIWNNQL